MKFQLLLNTRCRHKERDHAAYLNDAQVPNMPKAPSRIVVHPLQKPCKHCALVKPICLFELKPTESTYRNICRPCRNKAKRVLNRLKTKHIKVYGKPNIPCQVCNRRLPLVFDHCHKTSQFRGWLCKHCNAAIGKLGDDLDGIELAKTYLRTFDAALALIDLSGV